MKNSMNKFLGALTLLVAWHMASSIASTQLFPTPIQTIQALVELIVREDLLAQLAITLFHALIGLLIGVSLGLVTGLSILYFRLVGDLLYPVIVFVVVTPSFAFIPLLILWIGLNDLLPITVIVLCSGFPLAYTLVSSSKNIDPDLVDAALTLSRGRWDLLTHIVLPLSLTHVFSMVKLEVSHAIRLAFVTEYLAVSNGLGYLMSRAFSMLRVDQILALIIVLASIGLALTHLVEYIETLYMSRRGYRGVVVYG